MIDTADLERWATMDTYKGVYLTMEGLSGLARDYLAMRAIVEALAARTPFLIESQTGEFFYDCQACGEGSRDSPEAIDHEEDCLWAQARALIGPASERTKG